jgi:hypothetical protein
MTAQQREGPLREYRLSFFLRIGMQYDLFSYIVTSMGTICPPP